MNKIYYDYKIYDSRIIRLPEYDTIDVSRIYQDTIIFSNDKLIYRGRGMKKISNCAIKVRMKSIDCAKIIFEKYFFTIEYFL